MILDLPCTRVRNSGRKLTWNQELKRKIFHRNNQQTEEFKRNFCISIQEREQRNYSERSFKEIMNSKEVEIAMEDSMSTEQSCYGYYSGFIHLSMPTKFQDEFSLTFPCIRRMTENGLINARMLLLIQISELMKQSREKGEVDRGWLKCKRKYICDIDSLQAIQIFFEMKKRGGINSLLTLHRKYGGGCAMQVFFQRMLHAAHFLKKYKNQFTKTLSVESYENINEVTMPKTMKQLFCSICLLYDCNQHTLEDPNKEKKFQYVSPKNIIKDEENFHQALKLCVAFQDITKNGKISPVRNQVPCSEKCYRYLKTDSWALLRNKRAGILSPMVKGIIKMGIQMFSFSPCCIWYLIQDKKITCAHIFLFFIQDYNIIGRLQQKLKGSEVDRLKAEGRDDVSQPPQPKQRPKNVKVAHNEHSCAISSCLHYFVGQQSIDKNCEQCECRSRNFCIPQCLCDETCPIRKKGCACKKEECRTKKCSCFANKSECDPTLCKNCFHDSKRQCKNHQIMDGSFKKVRVGRSTVPGAGLGLFAGQSIKKDELIIIYSGEMIEYSVDLLRESLSVDNTFYNFMSPEGTVDARFMGNVARFINHGCEQRENVFPQNVLAQGRYRIAFYAKIDLQEDEQFFFDYDGSGDLYQNYKDKFPFITKKKKP